MIHISDLSWLKRFNHPTDYTKVGEHIDIIILSIDKENRKLQLGHKQLEEDPWNALEETFAVGSLHEGTVTRKDDKGALVQLQYGLEGFVPNRHMNKEDGTQVKADDTAQFMVIEFDRNEKRIVLSHARLWEQVIAEEKEVADCHSNSVFTDMVGIPSTTGLDGASQVVFIIDVHQSESRPIPFGPFEVIG